MKIAIVGGGFSGVMTAANLLRLPEGPAQVFLIEKGGRVGRGAAYGTEDPVHLLNVGASGMSAWPEDPGHFERWLRAQPEGASVCRFAPRRLYARYLDEILRQEAAAALPRRRLTVVEDEAVGARLGPDGSEVLLKQGKAVRVDKIVLALGNPPPRPLRAGARCIAEPWKAGALRKISAQDDVVIVGTGLTMVDAVLSLGARGHRGRIWALSRRGLLPRVHAEDAGRAPQAAAGELPRTVRGLLRGLRRAARAAGDWRDALDALRPRTQQIWRSLSAAERRRFLRHAQAWWDVHRHRVAPQIGRTLDELQASGRLKILAARALSIEETDGGVRVRVARRGAGEPEALAAPWVINATGPEQDLARLESPLVRDLLRQGLLRPGPLGLGADTAASGALIGRDAKASRVLFTLGPWLKGRLWESIAVPELREQARALAERLVSKPLDREPGA